MRSRAQINKNYRQLGLQMAGSFTIMAYTFVVTYAIIFVIDHIPGLKVRSTEEAEILGIDETEVRSSPSLAANSSLTPTPPPHSPERPTTTLSTSRAISITRMSTTSSWRNSRLSGRLLVRGPTGRRRRVSLRRFERGGFGVGV